MTRTFDTIQNFIYTNQVKSGERTVASRVAGLLYLVIAGISTVYVTIDPTLSGMSLRVYLVSLLLTAGGVSYFYYDWLKNKMLGNILFILQTSVLIFFLNLLTGGTQSLLVFLFILPILFSALFLEKQYNIAMLLLVTLAISVLSVYEGQQAFLPPLLVVTLLVFYIVSFLVNLLVNQLNSQSRSLSVLVEKQDKQLQNLEIIHSVAEKVKDTSDFHRLMSAVFEETKRLLSPDKIILFLYHVDEKELVPTEVFNTTLEKIRSNHINIDDDASSVNRCLAGDQCHFALKGDLTGTEKILADKLALGSLFIIPLRIFRENKEKVLGAMVLGYPEDRSFDAEEQKLGQILGAGISTAIYSAHINQQLKIENDLKTALITNIGDGVFTIDNNRTITQWNHAAEEITGLYSGSALGKLCHEIFKGVDASGAPVCHENCEIFKELHTEERNIPVDVKIVNHDRRSSCKKELWLKMNHSSIKNTDGALESVIHVFSDISSLKKLEFESKKFKQQSLVDDLTGLNNRRFLIRKLREELSASRRFSHCSACLMIDIDFFKVVNDTFGHVVGDQVLVSIGKLIKENLRQTDIAARYGGEEFFIILPHTDIDSARMTAEKIRKNIAAHVFTAEGHNIKLTVSIGVASTEHSEMKKTHDIISNADKALYTSKRGGRNTVSTYDS